MQQPAGAFGALGDLNDVMFTPAQPSAEEQKKEPEKEVPKSRHEIVKDIQNAEE